MSDRMPHRGTEGSNPASSRRESRANSEIADELPPTLKNRSQGIDHQPATLPKIYPFSMEVSLTSGGLCAKIALSQSSRRVFGQVGAFSVKRAILNENPLLESRIMRSAASGSVSKARTSKI